MLRAVLCTGFNTRSDVSKVEVVSSTRIKITFGSIHNYSFQQTILLSGTVHSQLNAEYVVKSVNGLTITVDNYDSSIVLSPGTILDGLSEVSTKVAPLGFIEKYTDVAGRSVFTTDEDEAYFYIDDRKPDTWDTSSFVGEYEFDGTSCTIYNLYVGKPYDAVLFDRNTLIESRVISNRLPVAV